LKILWDLCRLAMMLAGSGKITGMGKVISLNGVSPYFNALEHPARQSGVAAVNLLIVFSVSLFGITGIVPTVTKRKPDLWETLMRKDTSQKRAESGNTVKYSRSDRRHSRYSEFGEIN